MELNIQDFDCDVEDDTNLYQQPSNSQMEQIPENIVPIKVIKKGVQFQEQQSQTIKPIPKENARMVRPKMPNPKPQVSYDDILSKMGMFVSEGKLHLLDETNKQQYKQEKQQYKQEKQQEAPNIPANSYIYNKYFKEETQPQYNIRRPMTQNEYKRMLLEDILQREKIKQIKSTKLVMPTSNINMASGSSANLNKLFSFSQR
jgi:hypothetical protein